MLKVGGERWLTTETHQRPKTRKKRVLCLMAYPTFGVCADVKDHFSSFILILVISSRAAVVCLCHVLGKNVLFTVSWRNATEYGLVMRDGEGKQMKKEQTEGKGGTQDRNEGIIIFEMRYFITYLLPQTFFLLTFPSIFVPSLQELSFISQIRLLSFLVTTKFFRSL